MSPRFIRHLGATVAITIILLGFPVTGFAETGRNNGEAKGAADRSSEDISGIVVTDDSAHSIGRGPVVPAVALQEDSSPTEATRSLIERAWGSQVADGRALMRRVSRSAEDGQEASSSEADTTHVARMGLPAEDLTGDGLADAFSFEVTYPEDIRDDFVFSIHGLAGTDGSVLWSRHFGELSHDFNNLFPMSVPDLNGDGLGEILILTLDITRAGRDDVQEQLAQAGIWIPPDQDPRVCYGDSGIGGCVSPSQHERHWALQALSGADGSRLWRKVIDGAHAGVAHSSGNIPGNWFRSERAMLTTAAALLPVISGDHDGDGRPDIVLNTFDTLDVREFESADQGMLGGPGPRVDAEVGAPMVATRAEVLDGDTGLALFEKVQDFTVGGGGNATPRGERGLHRGNRPPLAGRDGDEARQMVRVRDAASNEGHDPPGGGPPASGDVGAHPKVRKRHTDRTETGDD